MKALLHPKEADRLAALPVKKSTGAYLKMAVVYATLAAVVTMFAGCDAGFCIVDAKLGTVTFRKSSGTFREIPVTIDTNGSRLMTLQRTDTNSYVTRWVGFDAKTQSESSILPVLNEYGGEAYAFTEDGQKLAYLDGSNQLFICTMTNMGVNLLPQDIRSMWPDIYDCRVVWLNADSVLVVPRLRGRIEVPVDIVHLGSNRVRRLCSAVESHHPILISPAGRYLVATETMADTRSHRLVVYDMATYRKVFEVTPDGEMSAYSVVWASDEELVFAVDNRICSQRIGYTTAVELTSLDPSCEAWLYAVDKRGNLHYRRCEYNRQSCRSKPVGGWRVFNLATKEDREIARQRINGRVLVSRDGGIVVAEVGI